MSRTLRCQPLSALPVGVPARLCRHLEASRIPARLADLGFVPDTPLEVVRVAPLGDPVEVEIRGYRLCLRREDIAEICVTPETPRS